MMRLSQKTVDQLRKHFNHLRPKPPKKQAPFPRLDRQEERSTTIPDGITEGIQQNVFLYLDHAAASSALDTHRAENAWIWAIDPDYNPDYPDVQPNGYQGYVRVRLQQSITFILHALACG